MEENKKQIALMENVAHLTIDLFEKLVDNEQYECIGGDDAIEIIIEQAKKFEAQYTPNKSYLVQMDDFVKSFLEWRERILREIPKCDIWFDKPILINGRMTYKVINHIFNDGAGNSYVEYNDKGQIDLNAFAELSNYELQSVADAVKKHTDEENKPNLYDEICKVLTWYEHPDEDPFDGKNLSDELYRVLCRVQKELF